MNPSVVIEKWDGLLYSIYNMLQSAKFAMLNKTFVNKNKSLFNKYKGERCFVLMNGPSVNKYDLSILKNEMVFCSNFFYRSELAKNVDPNYYCWADSTFLDGDYDKILADIRESCPHAKLLLNYKAYKKLGNKEDIYYSYCKHYPNYFEIRNDLSSLTSNYSTVAFHAIGAALYMGFSKIYVLGLDFPPGAFNHFADLGEDSECQDPLKETSKENVCGNYWNYTKSHYESFYLRNYADNHQQKIINLNPDSYIRAFEFDDFSSIL